MDNILFKIVNIVSLEHVKIKLLTKFVEKLTVNPAKILNINNTNNLEELIEDLEECYRKKNKYLMIKTTLLKNIKQIDKIPKKNEIINEFEDKIISREIILDDIPEQISVEILNIRINNSFVNANLN